MILVILGAGASYDSVPAKSPIEAAYGRERLPSRPPLADELFLDINPFAAGLELFEDCHQIVTYLRKPDKGRTIEQKLETLQAEEADDPNRKRQIAAVMYYLQYVISQCERQWNEAVGNITNHKTLLDQLRRAAEPVCIGTFNYDCMLERALPSVGVNIEGLDQYISHDQFKLFKLHGSIDWALEVNAVIPGIDDMDEWDVGRELRRRIDEIEVSDQFHIVSSQRSIGKIDRTPLFPAIAIPVVTKKSFVCPKEHLERLKELLPETKKMLMVGWSGTESHFLDLLRKSINRSVPALVVAQNETAARDIHMHITRKGVNVGGIYAEKGFSDFIASRQAETFLS